MAGAHDGELVTASLARWIARLTFLDLTADEATTLIVDSVEAWGRDQGWRVYRRARSVLPLPAPYQHMRSCVDIGCARPSGAPVVVEVDRSNRPRTVEKLLAEAAAGRIAIWVRWGTGHFEPPPSPVTMVTCPVVARRGQRGSGGLRYSRQVSDRPPPPHTDALHTEADVGAGVQAELSLIDPPGGGGGVDP